MSEKKVCREQRSRTWAFTINAIGDEVEPAVHPLWAACGKPDSIQYAKWQLERGDGESRLHLQGVIRFGTIKTMKWTKTVLGCPHAHVEIVRSWEHAKAYCGKAETRVAGPWEVGEDGPGQGKRTDLAEIVNKCTTGKTMKDLATEHPEAIVKFGRGLQHLLLLKNPPRKRLNVEVYIFYGAAGVGKTRLVHDLCPDVYTVFCLKNPWFDGYNMEDAILLDDYGPKLMDINLLKRILDIYPITVPVKGGYTAMNATKIFITTNYTMDNWYPTVGGTDFDALMRRCSYFNFDGNGKEEFMKLWTDRREAEARTLQTIRRPVPTANEAAAAGAPKRCREEAAATDQETDDDNGSEGRCSPIPKRQETMLTDMRVGTEPLWMMPETAEEAAAADAFFGSASRCGFWSENDEL